MAADTPATELVKENATEIVKENVKEFTLDEISKHQAHDDCWLIIGNQNNGGPKVYDITKYLDDHPGGAEVMLDVAGQDADEFFEDIGHSKEARNELKKYLIGNFKLDEAAIAAMKAAAEKKSLESKPGAGFMIVILVAILAIFFGVYTQMK